VLLLGEKQREKNGLEAVADETPESKWHHVFVEQPSNKNDSHSLSN
jgi:hypothetical protein